MKVIEKEKTTHNWWMEEVVYQIYPKSFYDSNGDGVGDLKGIIEKLPYLKYLGVTSLWICPIFTSPMADNGYDIADYQAIQPEFGTMADFDELIAAADELGIKIILDLVVNHTSDEHSWFQQAIRNPTSKYRDYYIFKEGHQQSPPNNWRSIFGGSVWEKVPEEENNYYFHTFDKKQPDLNWENSELRQAIYRMINWWLDKGIAGFRIDSITFIKKDQDYASLPADGADGLASVKLKGRNRPGIEKFLAELNQATFNNYPCVTIGEAPGVQYTEYEQYIGENGYFNMIFDFHYADIDVENGSEWFRQTNWQVPQLKELLFTSQLALQANGWGANFLENHDQPRSLAKYIRDKDYQNAIGAKALATLFFFLRGTPFIYQGQEIGMTNFKRESIQEFNDVSSIDNYHRSKLEGFNEEQALGFVNQRSRDNSRTPFQWSSGKNAGFSSGEATWLALAGDHTNVNAASQLDDLNSIFQYYRKLIHLRNYSNYSDTLIYGEFQPLDTGEQIIGYQRVSEAEILEIYVNLTGQASRVTTKGKILLSNYRMEEQAINGECALAPYQAIMIRKEEEND